jgi:hypothetical protein
MVMVINENNTINTYVIKLDLRHCLLPEDYRTIFNVLFCRRLDDKDCNIRRLTNTIAINTKVRRTFNEEDDDSNETFLIYYKFTEVELPRFTNQLISVYHEKRDKSEYKRLGKSKHYKLLGTFKTRILSVPEQYYILHQLEQYIEKKRSKGVRVELCL